MKGLLVEFVNYNGKKIKRIAKYKSYDSMPSLKILDETTNDKIVSLKGNEWRILQIQNKPARQVSDIRVRILVEKIDIGINLTD